VEEADQKKFLGKEGQLLKPMTRAGEDELEWLLGLLLVCRWGSLRQLSKATHLGYPPYAETLG
jgi:hypothetical protein